MLHKFRHSFFVLFFLLFIALEASDVLVLAHVIIDRKCCIDEDVFRYLKLEKGECRLIDKSTLEKHIDSYFINDEIALAGSAVNVVKGLTKLGNKCIVTGTIGNDKWGSWVDQEMADLGISFTHRKVEDTTNQCLCFITPDKERTMQTFIGASNHMKKEFLNPKDFEGLKFFHLEGYQIFNSDLSEEALKLAQKNKATISIDLATPHLAKTKKEQFLHLIKNYADIVFCNENEAMAISGEKNATDAAIWLSKLCSIAVVTQGKNGGVCHSEKNTIYFEAHKTEVKDCTGAGDLFSCGFIDAYLKNRPLEECLNFGRDVAARVVSVYGVDIEDKDWEMLKKSAL